jgi:hypothetical protein
MESDSCEIGDIRWRENEIHRVKIISLIVIGSKKTGDEFKPIPSLLFILYYLFFCNNFLSSASTLALFSFCFLPYLQISNNPLISLILPLHPESFGSPYENNRIIRMTSLDNIWRQSYSNGLKYLPFSCNSLFCVTL